ncbi:MAG: DUF3102 domain-containing protein [Firmicutes bacterium]|nr:DUF3102 domain-containing protein [[Eubacterium] siraeum]MCM1486815.1 DUF3102 domain-containing protein [Bacillota bacterium]
MNEIVQTPKERAALLDCRINANAQTAAESIVAVGRDLKTMRDEKLYTELGFETFENYCNEKAHISQRSAYNFIKAYETYGEQLTAIQHLGITKLVAMTALEPEERKELIESGEAESLSTRKLEKKIEEMQKKCDQLTMELEAAESKATDESEAEKLLKKQNEELSKELEALRSVQDRQDQAADKEKEMLQNDIELLRKQRDELSSKVNKIAETERAAVKKAEDAAAKKQREAEEKHSAEIAKLKEQLAEAEKKTALQAPAKKQAPPDTQKERVKFYCEECLRSFNSALEATENVEEEETKTKCRQAIGTIVKKMEELIQ